MRTGSWESNSQQLCHQPIPILEATVCAARRTKPALGLPLWYGMASAIWENTDMSMKVRYTNFNSEIVSESRAGVVRDYVPDPLGSTVALLDGSQNQTDKWTYWPYGETVRLLGSNPTKFLFVGSQGYRQDNATNTYVRARMLLQALTRWMTQDPI